MSSLSDVKDVADQRKTGTIRISDVSHRYGRGRDEVTALGPVDLTVDPGSFLVLVGASGCGKSTLLRLLAGFESPSEGSVQVSGYRPDTGSDRGCGVPAAAAVPLAHGRRKRGSGTEVRQGAAGAARRTTRPAVGAGRAWKALPTARSGRSAAASSSGSRSRGRWPPRRRCSCSTNRSRPWTRSPANGCRRTSVRSVPKPAARQCSSRTAPTRPPSSARGSWC